MQDFIILCIGHLENTDSMNCADLPNVDIFQCITFFKKSHFCFQCYLVRKKKKVFKANCQAPSRGPKLSQTLINVV